MGLADILSTPFLISLGITFLLVGILGVFLSQKIMDQNHKISSMMGLVTTMAEELNFLRSRFQMNYAQPPSVAEAPKNLPTPTTVRSEDPLIEVSDDDDSEEESDEDDESDDESDDEKLIISEDLSPDENVSTIKVIQMGETMTFKEQEEEEIGDLEEATFITEDSVSVADESVSGATVSDASVSEASVSEASISQTSVSEISASNKKKVGSADLKKMTIQNLRDIAVKKGFSGDVSKMKKADVLKIVESLL